MSQEGFPTAKRSLAQRLGASRKRSIVGRDSEKALFRNLIKENEPSVVLLHIHGPGGVGKTTLVAELATVAREEGLFALVLDGRNLDPSPDGFYLALNQALGLPVGSPLPQAMQALGRTVLFLDTYERLMPLDSWLREQFLPQLPEDCFVVFAGRNPPTEPWRSDPGWRDLVQSLSLRNLRPEDSRDFLGRRGVPEPQHAAVLAFTHGHPLALSLVADVLEREGGQLSFRPEAAPDVVHLLLSRFVEQVPTPQHRMALEACAVVLVTTEAILQTALQCDDAHPYFEWLRSLSFVQAGPFGLFPHDLAREALLADLKWRNPDWNSELHRRVRSYYTRKLQETSGLEQQRILIEDVYLHRENPMVRPFLEWGQMGSAYGETANASHFPAILALAQQHLGATETARLQHWLSKPYCRTTVYHDSQEGCAGFLARLYLQQASPTDLQADPVARQAWAFVQRQTPLREGEQVVLFRFWLTRDSFQAVSPVQSLIFINAVQDYFATPKLAWSFFPCAQPDFWQPAMTYMELHPLPELAFASEAHSFGVFGRDWRTTTIPAWLEMLGQKELLTEPIAVPAKALSLLVLSQPEFDEAVRQALKDYARPAVLAHNPLLRSRLVLDKGGEVAHLRKLIWEGAKTLEQNPKDEKLYRALERTYLDPAPTQERAAELLDLPFSTYRRHLTQGIERLSQLLWQWEIGGVA